MPESVREVIDRRLGRLSEGARGRWLWRRSRDRPSRWSSWTACRRQVSASKCCDALDEGVGARLVVETEGPFGTYTFAHALHSPGAFSATHTRPRQSRLHRAIGEALEELFEAGTITLPPSGTTMFGTSRGAVTHAARTSALAHHFVAAGQEETAARAVRYVTLAARQAFDELALDEALALLDRGRRILDRSRHVDRALAADLYLVLAQAFEIAGDGPGHEAAALHAADEARVAHTPEQLAMAAIAATDWMMQRHDDPRSQALCEEALASLGSEFPALRAQVLASLPIFPRCPYGPTGVPE